MKKLFGIFLLLLVYQFTMAQYISKEDKKYLKLKEDSLKIYSMKLIQGITADDRFTADSIFTRILMRALKTNHSFHYSFDSLRTISILYAPDSSFKIFTWQMMINDNVIRQHGAIQMRTADGSLKRFPLIDKSDVTINIKDTIGNNFGWIGAIYYRIVQKKSANNNFYTLLGYDENNINSTRKIIEVLTFEKGEPIFGGRYFSFENDALNSKTILSRYVMEYKKDAGPRLSFDADLDMIIVEHLVSETGDPNKKWTLVGDGDYEGFKWNNGRWVHLDKVYNYITPLGKEPVPKPLNEGGGNLFDNKLDNQNAEKPPTGTKDKPVKVKKNGND